MRKHRWIWLAVLAWLLIGGTAVVAPVAAQDAPNADDVTADQVDEVARTLYCPLCSGVRLDACELKACDQMKDMIAQKLAAGEDTETIRTYFVAQYGPQVLGEPPREGFNWLAWVLPFVALAGGGVFLYYRTRRMVRPPVNAPASTPRAEAAEDEYSAKLDEELTRYG
jgi:cytochrome c-type biogenesis protein CcmH